MNFKEHACVVGKMHACPRHTKTLFRPSSESARLPSASSKRDLGCNPFGKPATSNLLLCNVGPTAVLEDDPWTRQLSRSELPSRTDAQSQENCGVSDTSGILQLPAQKLQEKLVESHKKAGSCTVPEFSRPPSLQQDFPSETLETKSGVVYHGLYLRSRVSSHGFSDGLQLCCGHRYAIVGMPSCPVP